MDDIPTRTPTMADVAKAAGVSTATVSYLLSGRVDLLKRVGPQTRERIEQAIETLGYVQNKTARHLRRQRTERICVMLPELGNPFADHMANDIDRVANQRGYTTVVTTGKSDQTRRQVLREVEAGLADAVIADLDGCSDAQVYDLVEPLTRAKRPCLIVHPTVRPAGFCVLSHNRLAALQDVLDHVVASGHERIAYVANWLVTPDNPRADLVASFAASDANPLAKPRLLAGAHSRATAVEAARRILTFSPRPTAVLSESDFAAVAMMDAFVRAGLRVPNDIAVIGCGNAEEGQYCSPRLTTVGPATMSLTEETSHLLDVVENRTHENSRRFVVPWQLYRRESG